VSFFAVVEEITGFEETTGLATLVVGGKIIVVSFFARALTPLICFVDVDGLFTIDELLSFLQPFNNTDTVKNAKDSINKLYLFFKFRFFIADLFFKI